MKHENDCPRGEGDIDIVGVRKVLPDGSHEWYVYLVRGSTIEQVTQVLGEHADDPALSLTWRDARGMLAQLYTQREEDCAGA